MGVSFGVSDRMADGGSGSEPRLPDRPVCKTCKHHFADHQREVGRARCLPGCRCDEYEPKGWELLRPGGNGNGWEVINPYNERRKVSAVKTWDVFRAAIAMQLEWMPEADRDAAVAKACENPWCYGFHVLEDTAVTR